MVKKKIILRHHSNQSLYCFTPTNGDWLGSEATVLVFHAQKPLVVLSHTKYLNHLIVIPSINPNHLLVFHFNRQFCKLKRLKIRSINIKVTLSSVHCVAFVWCHKLNCLGFIECGLVLLKLKENTRTNSVVNPKEMMTCPQNIFLR